MISFTRVKLGAFGCFRDVEFSLRPGFNIICGNNEAGKSTFAAAIGATIFGLRRERERFIPWGSSGRCEAEVAFTVGGRDLVIARDFLTDRVRAVEKEGQAVVWRFEGKVSPLGRSSEREEYLSKIEEIWGFSEGDIFRNSVYVGQRDLPIDASGSLSGRLQHLLSGFSGLDYDRVVTDLENELYSLKKKPGGRARDRQLEETRTRLAELAILRQEARGALTAIEQEEEKIAILADWLDHARRDHEKGRLYVERVRTYHRLVAREKDLAGECARVEAEREKVETLLCRKQGLEEHLDRLCAGSMVPEGFPEALESYRKAKQRRMSLEAEVAAIEVAEETGKKRAARYLCFGAMVWVAAAAAGFRHPPARLLVFIIAAALTLAMVLHLVRFFHDKRRGALRQVEEMQAEIDLVDRSIAGMEARFPLVATAVGAGDSASDEFQAARQLQSELGLVKSTLEVLSPRAFLVERDDELRRELAVVAERLETVVGRGLTPLSAADFMAAEGTMRRLEREIAEKEEAHRERNQELAVLRRTSLDLGAIEDEIDELRTREARITRRTAALQLAVEVLRETIDEYRHSYLSRLAREVEGNLAALTAGRYRHAAFDPAFSLSLVAVGEGRPVELMSCGVQDQAYIAARLALGSILSHGKKLPFLLDDPLVNFDDERRTAALQAIDAVAGVHQVLLFVHDPRYLKVRGAGGWHKILLKNRRDDNGQLHLL